MPEGAWLDREPAVSTLSGRDAFLESSVRVVEPGYIACRCGCGVIVTNDDGFASEQCRNVGAERRLGAA